MRFFQTALSSLLVLLAGCDGNGGNLAHAGHPPLSRASSVAAPPEAPASEVTAAPSPPSSSVETHPSEANAKTVKPAKEPAKTVYVCPMHPMVVSEKPGVCPECNMKLEPKPAKEAPHKAAADHAGHAHTEHGR